MFPIKSITLFLFLLLIIFTGCQKENNVEPDSGNTTLYLKSIDDSTQSQIFNYSSGKLITFEHLENYKQLLTLVVTYDSLKRINTEHLVLSGQPALEWFNTFYYDGTSRLVKVGLQLKVDNGAISPFGHLEFKYNSKNQVERIEQYSNENEIWHYDEYQYSLEGNVSEKGSYLNNELRTKTTYTYDNKINPLWVLQSSYYWDVSFSKNNILSSYSESYDNEVTSTYMENYTYKYNKQDYPVKKTTERTDTYTGHSVGVSTYSYY